MTTILTEDDHKRVASHCNNAAWTLIERIALTQADLAALVVQAATARHHWYVVGTPSQKAHADLLFAWALARSGPVPLACDLAQAALTTFDASQGAPWERAFALAALAAARKAVNDSAWTEAYGQARDLGATLSGPDRRYFDAAFATIKAP